MVCTELPALRAECDRQPGRVRQLLVQIEARARERRPILELVRRLVGTDHEELRELSSGLPGFGPGQADEEIFGCPDGACDRRCTGLPGGPVPRCSLTGQPMTRR